MKAKRKRNIADEIMEGFESLRLEREGKLTLRTTEIEIPDPVEITGREIAAVRKKVKASQAVFAGYLRTNPRTLQNWEQGRSEPNDQAAALIRLVDKFPDTLERLASIGTPARPAMRRVARTA
jgi:putative transcriptional regulator